MPLRDAPECYDLFEKHPEEFKLAHNFGEFCALAKLGHLDSYAGGWVEKAFQNLKAGKKAQRGLILPSANTFRDLFIGAHFIPTNDKHKPAGGFYLSGTGALSKYLGGTRGYSKTQPDVRSHSGARFYGTYVVLTPEFRNLLGLPENECRYYSFEAIRRDDGILICIRDNRYVGGDWVALINKDENIETLFDEKTRLFLAAERQAEIDAWGSVGW